MLLISRLSSCMMIFNPADYTALDSEQQRQLSVRCGYMSDANGTMVRRTSLGPCVEENARWHTETVAAVGVACLERGAEYTIALGELRPASIT